MLLLFRASSQHKIFQTSFHPYPLDQLRIWTYQRTRDHIQLLTSARASYCRTMFPAAFIMVLGDVLVVNSCLELLLR